MTIKFIEILKNTNVVFFSISAVGTVYNVLYLFFANQIVSADYISLAATGLGCIIFYVGIWKPDKRFIKIQILVILICLFISLCKPSGITTLTFVVILYVLCLEYGLFKNRFTLVIITCIILSIYLTCSILYKTSIDDIFNFIIMSITLITIFQRVKTTHVDMVIQYMSKNNKILEQLINENNTLIDKLDVQNKKLYVVAKNKEMLDDV